LGQEPRRKNRLSRGDIHPPSIDPPLVFNDRQAALIAGLVQAADDYPPGCQQMMNPRRKAR
jgi:hypothetical protein